MNFDQVPTGVWIALMVPLGITIIWSILTLIGEHKTQEAVDELARIDLDNPPQKDKHRYMIAPSEVTEALKMVADPRMEAHPDAYVGAWGAIEQGAYWYTLAVGIEGLRVVGNGRIFDPIEYGVWERGWCVTHHQTSLNEHQCFYPFAVAYRLGFGQRQKRRVKEAEECVILPAVVSLIAVIPDDVLIDGSKTS